jgi:hypothetical protein
MSGEYGSVNKCPSFGCSKKTTQVRGGGVAKKVKSFVKKVTSSSPSKTKSKPQAREIGGGNPSF